MVSHRNQVIFWTAPLIALTWLMIVVVDPTPGGQVIQSIAVGFFLGAMYGQTTLAAVWTVVGPGPLARRLRYSLVWIALLAVAVAMNTHFHDWPSRSMAVVISLCLVGQWIVVQSVLWGLVVGFGLHLHHAEDRQHNENLHQVQFGIRQLIFVTTIVGVILGIGRVIIDPIKANLSPDRVEMVIFVFLAVAAALLTLPLVVAGLMRHLAIPGVALTLVLVGVITAFEMPLLQVLQPRFGPETSDFIAINTFTALMILTVLAIVRINGYNLARFQKPSAQ